MRSGAILRILIVSRISVAIHLTTHSGKKPTTQQCSSRHPYMILGKSTHGPFHRKTFATWVLFLTNCLCLRSLALPLHASKQKLFQKITCSGLHYVAIPLLFWISGRALKSWHVLRNVSRVGYWEAPKWVSKVRDCSSKNKNTKHILLKTSMNSGHFGEGGRYQHLKTTALQYAFLMKTTDL